MSKIRLHHCLEVFGVYGSRLGGHQSVCCVQSVRCIQRSLVDISGLDRLYPICLEVCTLASELREFAPALLASALRAILLCEPNLLIMRYSDVQVRSD